MVLAIIFSLVGMALGEAVFYNNGWIIGGALGFLITRIFQMGNTIKRLERDIQALLQRDAQESKAPLQHVSPGKSEPAVVAPTPAEQTKIPLAERLKAHGIELPPETVSVIQQPIANTTANSAAPPWAMEQPHPTQPNAPQKPQANTPKREITPSPAEKAFAYVRRFFTEGNPIVRIGMVVMFFGLSFLVKYASNQGLLPIELRMTAVAAVAMVLIGLGWKTRAKEGGYGLVLQGGGIAALYLTVFAAAKMYSLMPTSVAFGLMFVIVMLGAALAVLQ
ncbi:MAG TPA: DUF2339 domain-containing protein, partial [Cellvibrio sp.]|nr:DUF2339 domain-containing protein [Cellvibrio sp.]